MWDKGRELVDDVYRAVRSQMIKTDSKGHMYIGDIAGRWGESWGESVMDRG